MHTTTEVNEQTARIEELIHKLESSADPASLATARELVQSVMELYSAGLERIVAILAAKGEPGREILAELGRDQLVGNLLAANGLHPLDLEERVRRALDKLRGSLGSHASIDLLSFDDTGIRLRVRSHSSGCGSPAGSLKQIVADALYEAAPDLAQVVVEEDQPSASGFVPLEKLGGYVPTVNGGANGGANGKRVHP